jgi:hypothetical protein
MKDHLNQSAQNAALDIALPLVETMAAGRQHRLSQGIRLETLKATWDVAFIRKFPGVRRRRMIGLPTGWADWFLTMSWDFEDKGVTVENFKVVRQGLHQFDWMLEGASDFVSMTAAHQLVLQRVCRVCGDYGNVPGRPDFKSLCDFHAEGS